MRRHAADGAAIGAARHAAAETLAAGNLLRFYFILPRLFVPRIVGAKERAIKMAAVHGFENAAHLAWSDRIARYISGLKATTGHFGAIFGQADKVGFPTLGAAHDFA